MAIPSSKTASGAPKASLDAVEALAIITAVVFDAGPGNNMTISDCVFIDGLFVTDSSKEIELIDNFIEQTGSKWTKEPFDPANARHARASNPKAPIVMSGIVDPLAMGTSALTQALLAGEPITPAAPTGEQIKAALSEGGDAGSTGPAE